MCERVTSVLFWSDLTERLVLSNIRMREAVVMCVRVCVRRVITGSLQSLDKLEDHTRAHTHSHTMN